MCPCSYVYSVEDIQKMNDTQLGQAIWEYTNDQVVSEMVEAYGSVDSAARAAVDCFSDDADSSEATLYIINLGYDAMVTAVVAYLETMA